TDLAAAKPSLTDDKSGDKATVPGTITPPPSAKGAGVVKKKDKAKGDDSEADEDDDDSGEESEEELIEPEKPLSAAEKAERIAAATAHGEQLRLQIDRLEQRQREIEDAIGIEVTAKMQAARDALATHDGYQAWLTGPGDPRGPEKVAALNALRQRDSALDQNLKILEPRGALNQRHALREENTDLQQIEKLREACYKEEQGHREEMINLEVAGRATLVKRLKHSQDKKERRTKDMRLFKSSFDPLMNTHGEALDQDADIKAALEAMISSSEEFCLKFGEREPDMKGINAYLNEPRHYDDSYNKEKLAAYESLESVQFATIQRCVNKLAPFDKNLPKLYRSVCKGLAEKRERKRLKAQIQLLEIEHRLAATKAQFDTAQKAKNDLDVARELLATKAKRDPRYADAPRRQAEARALLEEACPGFMEAYTASEQDRKNYGIQDHFYTKILEPLFSIDPDYARRDAWQNIEAEQIMLEQLRSELEETDPDYLATLAAFEAANALDHRGSSLLEDRKHLLEEQRRYKAFLARRKA
ncbi:MAG: hypothetical protein QG604_963, partial [Candidatus Dependentiae bacterium]|nr:hypothetical protein [Candidatus Dependentiae bacterium]